MTRRERQYARIAFVAEAGLWLLVFISLFRVDLPAPGVDRLVLALLWGISLPLAVLLIGGVCGWPRLLRPAAWGHAGLALLSLPYALYVIYDIHVTNNDPAYQPLYVAVVLIVEAVALPVLAVIARRCLHLSRELGDPPPAPPSPDTEANYHRD